MSEPVVEDVVGDFSVLPGAKVGDCIQFQVHQHSPTITINMPQGQTIVVPDDRIKINQPSSQTHALDKKTYPY